MPACFYEISTGHHGEFSNILYWAFHGGGRYHIETSPLICGVNQWTGFYMITATVMKELNHSFKGTKAFH